MRTLILAAILLMLHSQTLWAESPDSPSTANLFAAPCLEMGVPEAVARAIAVVESGLKPWVLNIEGRSFHFNSKKEALTKAEEARAAGRSFDVGLMQVNNWWLSKYDISLEAALDPVANVYFGVWILKEELLRHGNLKAAVGAYHPPTKARASRYADQVMAALEGKRRPARRNVPSTAVKTQDVVEKARPQQLKNRNILKPEAQGKSVQAAPMLIASPNAGLAVPDSMKVAATAPDNSMKVGK